MHTAPRQPMKQFSENNAKSDHKDTFNALDIFIQEEERLLEALRTVQMGRHLLERSLKERGELPPSDAYTYSSRPVTVTERPIERSYFSQPEESAPKRGYVKKSKGKRPIPVTYDIDGTYANKVLYILNKEGDVSTRQITDFILEQEPHGKDGKSEKERFDLVNLNVGKACTRLLEKGLVEQEKHGNANIYRLA